MTRGPLISASQLAAEEIRDLIESGTLEPGARVNAEELAESLQISRTPVRDALQDLKTEGLVEILPRRGIFVRRISRDEVHDVYEIKLSIEPVAAGWAAERGDDADREKLTSLVEELTASATTSDVKSCAGWVDEIHNLLFQMARSDVLSDVYRVFHARVKLLRHLNMGQPGRLEASVEQHRTVVQHVVKGESREARDAMHRHMLDAATSVQNLPL